MKEALKLAFEALGAYMSATDSEEDAKAHSLMAEAFFKIKEASANHTEDNLAMVARPEQPAPVQPDRTGMTYYKNDACKAKDAHSPDCICWTPTPPNFPTERQRTWVGLTDEERNVIIKIYAYPDNVSKATEEKLKAKNGIKE